MRHSLTARYKLMRKRARSRLQAGIPAAVLISLFVTAMEWMGYGGGWRRTGIPNPKPLIEIWWHPLVVAPLFLVGLILWPFRDISD